DREFFTAPRSSGFLTATDTGEDELLPQPVGVLLGELSGDLVETTHSADRDEECFVGGQSNRHEIRDLFPEMIFHLVDVRGRDDTVIGDVAAPAGDPILEVRVECHHDHPGAAAGGNRADCNTWCRASATTVHCAARSARTSRPAS